MKSSNTSFLLLAAALLTAGTAAAQGTTQSATANAKPSAQGRTAVLRGTPVNTQITETLRSASRIDNDSYVSQTGFSNYGNVDQTGNNQSADMVQINSSTSILGNDGYQKQRNGGSATGGTTGENTAFMTQIGGANYADQDQAGNLNYAVVEQGGVGAAVDRNYSVQQQVGGNNYGFVDQDSNGSFAHQFQTSDPTLSTVGGGFTPGGINNGNYADTRQGNLSGAAAGTNGADAQWSQVVQNGQNNRAIVRQDHN